MQSTTDHTAVSQPFIIAIETSGIDCSVALFHGPDLLAASHYRVPHIHDSVLATMVQRMMGDLAMEWTAIDAVAVSLGPGSFTGLRIGMAFAKGLCFESRIVLIGVPTLTALARAATTMSRPTSCTRILAAYPSQRGHLYAQSFSATGEALGAEALYTSEQFAELLHDDVFVCTSTDVPECTHHAHRRVVPLRAEHLIDEALMRYHEGNGMDAERCVPLYVQDFVPRVQEKTH